MSSISKAIEFTTAAPVMVCSDLRAALAFYTDKLGFEIEFTHLDPPIYAGVCRGPCSIHLSATSKPGASNKAAWKDWNQPADICFFISDVDGLYEEFSRRGVEMAGKPTTQSYGIRDIDVVDPDGHVLRFNQVLHRKECDEAH